MRLQSLNFISIFVFAPFLDLEILILSCWLGFVALAYVYAFKVINNIFSKRRENLHEDMLSYLYSIKNKLNTYLSYHLKLATRYDDIMKIYIFSKLEVIRILIRRQLHFKSILGSQTESKLQLLSNKEGFVAVKVQDNLNRKICTEVNLQVTSKDWIFGPAVYYQVTETFYVLRTA
jgi:vacuolar-type H+-ATPase subunit I/STV1